MNGLVIALDSLVTKGRQHVAVDVDDEVVMMSPDRGLYYAAGETGSRILRLLERPRTVRELCEAMEAQFDVEPATCQRDVVAFVRELALEGLVIVGSPG